MNQERVIFSMLFMSPRNEKLSARRPKLLVVCSFLVFFLVPQAFAERGAVSIANRGGTSINRGNLSRDQRYPTYGLAVSRIIGSDVEGLGTSLANVFSASHSTFYTQNKDELKFPLVARAAHQLIEPAFLYDLCFFSYAAVRPCFAAGISAVYLRHNANNYQMYTAFPGQARLQFVSRSGLLLEFGGTFRRFSFRQDGNVAWNQDVTAFVGMGLFLSGGF
jgi:hypothetical protein